ncbi:hypothetical protein JMUB7554_27900 [Staphylococcus aureus]
MTKDELIARLRSLGEQLNRDVSLTGTKEELALRVACLLYTSDAADDTPCVDLGGRRIIKKETCLLYTSDAADE